MDNINLNIVAGNRKPASMLGAFLGCQYFKTEVRDQDPDFQKKEFKVKQNGNLDLITNRSPRRYRVTDYDVTKVEIGQDDSGATVVFLNKGEESEVIVPFESGMENLGIVRENAIADSLKGNKQIIFADPAKLANRLNQLNENEIARCEKLIADTQKAIKNLRDAIQKNNEKALKYTTELTESAKGLCVEDKGDTAITVEVTETTE